MVTRPLQLQRVGFGKPRASSFRTAWVLGAIPRRWLSLAVTAAILSFSSATLAGTISFKLSLTGTQLTLGSSGDSPAFFPAVFRLRPDGSWDNLAPIKSVTELAPGGQMVFAWPEARPAEPVSELERIQPVMVNFFDAAGVRFGQISLFRSPPAAPVPLSARYANSGLQLERPKDANAIRATWLLWPQEEGIRTLRAPLRIEHPLPRSLRIDWAHQGDKPLDIHTGTGQPVVTMIHETAQGYAVQQVPGGGRSGREQRAPWLDASAMFYRGALAALALGVLVSAFQWLRRLRRRTP